MITLAVDVMGGDHGPVVTLQACRQFLLHRPQARLLLVGSPQARPAVLPQRAAWLDAAEVVTMDDTLEVALRRKRDSSMRRAIEQVRDGQAQAAISAGNTGALMAVARHVLKTLDGIDRPAIAGQFPNARGTGTTMLDMGANVDCTPQHLLQFAVMGSALVSVLQDIPEPTVGLLNVGEEAIKGNEIIKKTAELLRFAAKNGDLNFYGNVEGNDIFKGSVDIVVCDGFVGNVALKASEGLANMVTTSLKASFKSNIWGYIAAIFAYPVLKDFKSKVDHRCYNGAALLGLRGLVFKSHGAADAFAFERALLRAYDAVDQHLMQKVQDRITHAAASMLAQGEAPTQSSP